MLKTLRISALLLATAAIMPAPVAAEGVGDCRTLSPSISFVEMASFDALTSQPVLLKGKLKLPNARRVGGRCRPITDDRPAVVILHGSNGVDFRGDFYARGLNAAGIATLEIDMWEARGVAGIDDRPGLPIATLPDAFAALAFLSAYPGIDPQRIGVIGFSWGGVMTLGSAETTYVNMFGGGLSFAAHIAHYPVCYGANRADILFGLTNPPGQLTPEVAGTQFLDITGAPLLIQIGDEDDYDNGAAACLNLGSQLLDPADQAAVSVNVYPGATHTWDKLEVPFVARDPFADQGAYLLGQTTEVPEVRVEPDVDQAMLSRARAVRFFLTNL
jgi:dienelactone hydrolase